MGDSNSCPLVSDPTGPRGAVTLGVHGLVMPKARLIAFYLPQFHPIAENDKWWGKGFTEWTNVAAAKPLFGGHCQPRLPADLGFYDLRVPEVRAQQAELARAAGIEGFCYWHYWFAGKRLLERPFNEVLRSGQPDFPFCLGWANQTWTGIWHGAASRILIEQTYPGQRDHESHFYCLLDAFHDPRYIRVRNKPLFLLYRPMELPKPREFIECWQALAVKNGLPGIHFVAHSMSSSRYDHRANGFDAGVIAGVFRVSNVNSWQRALKWAKARAGKSALEQSLVRPKAFARALFLKAMKHAARFRKGPQVLDYSEAMLHFLDDVPAEHDFYPCIVPNWDNSPRSARNAVVLDGSTPALFRAHLREALDRVAARHFEDRIVFVKSWNEWAEGNYLEPDQRFGHQYLDVVRTEVIKLANDG